MRNHPLNYSRTVSVWQIHPLNCRAFSGWQDHPLNTSRRRSNAWHMRRSSSRNSRHHSYWRTVKQSSQSIQGSCSSQRVLLERISMVGQHDVGRGHVLQRRAKIGNQRRDVVDGACAGHDKVLRKPRQRVGNTFSASGDGPRPPATIVIHSRAEIETTHSMRCPGSTCGW